MHVRPVFAAILAALVCTVAACGADEKPAPAAPAAKPEAAAPAAVPSAAPAAAAIPPTPDSLPKGLVLSLAQFVKKEGTPVPGPARLEFLYRKDGKWQTSFIEDDQSNVFHKAFYYEGPVGPRLMSLVVVVLAGDSFFEPSGQPAGMREPGRQHHVGHFVS